MTEFTNGRDFATYAKGMDIGFTQKWDDLSPALTTTSEGDYVLDIGCGTGVMVAAIAQRARHAHIIGVEPSAALRSLSVDATAHLPNARIVDGVAGDLPMPDSSVNVVLFASVMHEVFSYQGYDHDRVRDALHEAARVLRPGGAIAIRDGVAPTDGDDKVAVELLTADAVASLRRFERDFRPAHPSPGIETTWVADDVALMSRKDAFEFLSKKDYHENWDSEVQEEFGVFTREEWERELKAAGFISVRLHTYVHPWVRDNRYEGHVRLRTGGEDGPVEPWPDTTIVAHAARG